TASASSMENAASVSEHVEGAPVRARRMNSSYSPTIPSSTNRSSASGCCSTIFSPDQYRSPWNDVSALYAPPSAASALEPSADKRYVSRLIPVFRSSDISASAAFANSKRTHESQTAELKY